METPVTHLDFPNRLYPLLDVAGITTVGQLEAALASGTKIPGVGPAGLQALRESLEDYHKQETARVADLLKRDVLQVLPTQS